MKMAGRRTGGAYDLYGFIPRVENGKHSAICMSCNRVLQNTAAVRLQRHRNSCIATRVNKGNLSQLHNVDRKHVRRKTVPIQQNESINSNVKIEESNMGFDDQNINDNANDNTTYEDIVEETKLSRRIRKHSMNEGMNHTCSVSYKHKEHYDSFNQEENPIQSPVTTQQQPPIFFESYHPNSHTTNNSHFSVDNEIQEADDEDLINIEEELDVIQNLMPRSKESKQLQDELSKAETEYYRCKALYFAKLTENCKIKRTLMLLESRKLQLEIEKLNNDF